MFKRLLEDYPEKRKNLRITGLRGVGKTVLLKEYEKIARDLNWVVIRRDLGPRLRDEEDFALAITGYFQEALEELSGGQKLVAKAKAVADSIEEITLPFAGGVKLKDRAPKGVLEDRLAKALIQIGKIAHEDGKGVAFLFDEAHSMYDDKSKKQFPLGALLSAFVAAQDDDAEPLPVMLVLCGLPPLVGNIHAAKSNAERFFRGSEIANLPFEPRPGIELSEAALALTRPAEEQGSMTFTPGLAEQIAHDVDGYPYFIQWFGEQLWEAADYEGKSEIDEELYQRMHGEIRETLDKEFFEPRYHDARNADQKTLRIAASLGEEKFTLASLIEADGRSEGAVDQSLRRLGRDNLIYRDDRGVYAYTAPVFGDFLRRRHPPLPEDR